MRPSGTPNGSPTPEQIAAALRASSAPDRRWSRASDILTFGLVAVGIVASVVMLQRNDARSERMAAVIEARTTPCPCLTDPPP